MAVSFFKPKAFFIFLGLLFLSDQCFAVAELCPGAFDNNPFKSSISSNKSFASQAMEIRHSVQRVIELVDGTINAMRNSEFSLVEAYQREFMKRDEFLSEPGRRAFAAYTITELKPYLINYIYDGIFRLDEIARDISQEEHISAAFTPVVQSYIKTLSTMGFLVLSEAYRQTGNLSHGSRSTGVELRRQADEIGRKLNIAIHSRDRRSMIALYHELIFIHSERSFYRSSLELFIANLGIFNDSFQSMDREFASLKNLVDRPLVVGHEIYLRTASNAILLLINQAVDKIHRMDLEQELPNFVFNSSRALKLASELVSSWTQSGLQKKLKDTIALTTKDLQTIDGASAFDFSSIGFKDTDLLEEVQHQIRRLRFVDNDFEKLIYQKMLRAWTSEESDMLRRRSMRASNHNLDTFLDK